MEASTAAVGDAVLQMRRGDVRVGGEKAEHGETEAAENQYEKSDDDAENELAHEFLRDALLWQMELGWALVVAMSRSSVRSAASRPFSHGMRPVLQNQ